LSETTRWRGLPTSTLAVTAAAFAAQGFGYAAIVSTLPTFKERLDLTETLISAILLGVCVAAAGGSVLADVIAVRRGSRWALAVGFGLQAVSLVVAINASTVAMFTVAVVVYGVGLGCVDAAANMAGALAEARSSTPLFGRLYAAYTVAAITGALATSGAQSTGLHALTPVIVAAVLAVVVAALVLRFGDRYITARPPTHEPQDRARLPLRGIWMVGGLVFAAFVVDSAVATWSTLYMEDGLGTTKAVAPLAYAAYLGVVLAGRLAADPMVRRWGRLHTGIVGSLVALVGCVLVVAVHAPGPAVVGFALAGGAAGLLVPVAFSWAGELDPDRSDEVVARVNLFNYGGALIGAVALGALAGNASALGFGFALPAVALVVALPLLRAHRRSAQAPLPDQGRH